MKQLKSSDLSTLNQINCYYLLYILHSICLQSYFSNSLQYNISKRDEYCIKHVNSFKMPHQSNSKLPFLLFIDTIIGVDSRGVDCTKSKYSVLWALPIPCAFGA